MITRFNNGNSPWREAFRWLVPPERGWGKRTRTFHLVRVGAIVFMTVVPLLAPVRPSFAQSSAWDAAIRDYQVQQQQGTVPNGGSGSDILGDFSLDLSAGWEGQNFGISYQGREEEGSSYFLGASAMWETLGFHVSYTSNSYDPGDVSMWSFMLEFNLLGKGSRSRIPLRLGIFDMSFHPASWFDEHGSETGGGWEMELGGKIPITGVLFAEADVGYAWGGSLLWSTWNVSGAYFKLGVGVTLFQDED